MKKSTLKIILLACAALLVAELLLAGLLYLFGRKDPVTIQTTPSETSQLAKPTEPPPSSQATEAPATIPAPTDATEPTQPTTQYYTLTFVGDCTLGSNPDDSYSPYSLVQTVGTDYGYPFRNVLDYFENDDFTMANLEVVFGNGGSAADKLFTFRGPAEFVQILNGSSVEAVTLANNHILDFGTGGYNSTKQVLDDGGVAYVEKDSTRMFTTESGLVIGLYAASFDISKSDMVSDIRQLRKDGAEIIVASLHWGLEGKYRYNSDQELLAKAAIDAGADIVHGHHPHVLQRIEEYNGGIIYYSLGNFSFGGNTYPRDMDSAVIQQQVIRDPDGTVRLGEMTIIPCSISSISDRNNFQPTPYPEDSTAYHRVLSKLDGSFTGPDLVVDYSFLHPTEPTVPESGGETESTTGGETEGTTGGETEGTTGGEAAATE